MLLHLLKLTHNALIEIHKHTHYCSSIQMLLLLEKGERGTYFIKDSTLTDRKGNAMATKW